jgi:hypothetical protein
MEAALMAELAESAKSPAKAALAMHHLHPIAEPMATVMSMMVVPHGETGQKCN